MVNYYFPPLAGAGSLRAVKLAKYLPEFGWRPVVLTVKDVDHLAYDGSLAAEIPPDAVVLRTGSLDPTRVSGLVRAALKRLRPGRSDELAASQGLYRLVSGNMRSQLEGWLFLPDSRIGWVLPALHAGVERGRKLGVRAIFSSSPPVSTHLLAHALKQRLHLPWIADFRDGWTTNPAYRPATRLHRAFDSWLERQTLAEADRVVTANPSTANDFQRGYGPAVAAKTSCLPNGFDPSDFAGMTPREQNPFFTITYTGILYGTRTPEYLLRAVKAATDELPCLRRDLRLVFVGTFQAPYREAAERLGLTDLLQTPGYVSHRESVQYMLQADVLLLVMHTGPGYADVFPAKVFEYLGARKPVLGLVPEGGVAQLLRSSGIDTLALPDDVPAIKTTLLECYRRWKRGELHGPTVSLPPEYTRRGAAARLAGLLDGLMEAPA